MRCFFVIIAVLAAGLSPVAAAARLRGDDASIAAAQKLLEQAGGAAAWAKRTMDVSERGYLRNGETAELRIIRDFERRARLIDRRTPSAHFVEWVSPEGGWTERDDVRETMSAEELASELYGFDQEPYAIYHQMAKGGGGFRVELREEGSLLAVYDDDDRFLCWFRLAPNGMLRGWGNFYDGRINEHYYGPIDDMGDANLPRWGAAADGGFRFEYVSVQMKAEPIQPPGK